MLRLVAHELRAHVTVLDGYADLLQDEALRRDPERFAAALAQMRAQIDSLRQMAGHLAQGVDPHLPERLAFQPATVDLASAAAEAIAFCRATARARGISLVCDTRALGDGLVQGDRFHLVTAMRNLLENACRYGPQGGTVRLSLARSEGSVEILVHDQGDGLRRVGDSAFQPYVRGDGALEQAPTGLGLGLSLVAQVAQLHGGVAMWGDEEGGAAIGFRFPAPELSPAD